MKEQSIKTVSLRFLNGFQNISNLTSDETITRYRNYHQTVYRNVSNTSKYTGTCGYVHIY